MLRATGVSFGYGATPMDPTESSREATGDRAVASADLHVGTGDVVAVLGPNGAGKSTLLRLLDGQLRPREGHIRRPPRRTPEGRLAYGWAGEDTPHFESLPGLDNALFFARAAGLDRASALQEVSDLMDRLTLSAWAARQLREYSFGARRKLVLAEALAHSPKVLLLDEPTVGLDLQAKDALAELVRERAEGGAAIVMASHDTAFVQRVASEVVFMVHGRTRGGGSPLELIRARQGRAMLIFTLREPFPKPLDAVGSGWTVARAGNPLMIDAPAGQAVLPEVCRTLLDAGAGIQKIEVRPTGLEDAFRRLTGEELAPASQQAADAPTTAGPATS